MQGKLGTFTNSNMLNSMAIFRKVATFWGKFGPEIKIACLS